MQDVLAELFRGRKSITRLKSFFHYYGGKTGSAHHYPPPKYDTIVEACAGAAGYALQYSNRKVFLYDLNEKVIALWQYLICVTPEEILSLPLEIAHVDELKVCQEAKYLIGFWLGVSGSHTRNVPVKWMREGKHPNSFWGESIRGRISRQVKSIKHWTAVLGSYESIPNFKATYFVDPPYQNNCGRVYKLNAINYAHLGEWCKSRNGQVIACEQEGADWLDFKYFRKLQTMNGSCGKGTSREVIWTKSE